MLESAQKPYLELIEEQSKYNPTKDEYPFKHPFQSSVMRFMNIRNVRINEGNPEGKKRDQELDAARFDDERFMAPTKSIRGKIDAVKRMVDCGILKPETIETLGRVTP